MRHQHGLRTVRCPCPEVQGNTTPGDEPEAPRRRAASSIVIQEITDELRAFGGRRRSQVHALCHAGAEGIEINQLDPKDVVVREIFCKNRFTSRATSFGLHSCFRD